MENNQIRNLGWGLWVKWVLATSLSFFVSDGIGVLAPNTILIGGLFIGILQWLFVFRSRFTKAYQWILYSTVGWAVGWILGNISRSLFTFEAEPSLLIALTINGGILGVMQWFFIRKVYSKSSVWVIANTIGLPIAYGLSWFIIFPILLGDYDGLFSGPVDSLIRGALFGAITGFILIWFSKLPSDEVDTAFSNVQ